MTEELVKSWVRGGAEEIRDSSGSPGVQKPEEIERDLKARLDGLQVVANRLYDRWIEGLSRGG
jgi:hypothetical protein